MYPAFSLLTLESVVNRVAHYWLSSIKIHVYEIAFKGAIAIDPVTVSHVIKSDS